MTNDTKETLQFYAGLLIMTIGIWWWFTPLNSLPNFIPFLIGTVMAVIFFIDNKNNPTSHSVGNGIGMAVSGFLLGIYVIGLTLSFFI